MAATVTSAVASSSRESQRRSHWPTAGVPSAVARVTSLATAIWSAEPGTIRMMKADRRAASEP